MSSGNRSEDEIFEAALQHATREKRAAYLNEACGDDARLRERVEALLKAHDQAGEFLEQTPAGVSAKTFVVTTGMVPVTECPGDRIGRYKLRENLGEGGCGVVYVVEQEEPVRRRVALKVIKLGMDTRQVVARFEAERQALALMEHLNIAKVLDAGATGTGRPYFVMELVGGVKITDYCDQNRLTTRQRLDLFIQVCRALQHAHQKGVIHRDIKPSNVLVSQRDGAAVPKVIDFGIAKATQGRLTNETLAARAAASDKCEIRNPKSEIDKDLDWIVMKCLEKDRARRYETANGLARDIERHLNQEPVLARPPSRVYRLHKFIRRN